MLMRLCKQLQQRMNTDFDVSSFVIGVLIGLSISICCCLAIVVHPVAHKKDEDDLVYYHLLGFFVGAAIFLYQTDNKYKGRLT